MIFFHRYSAKSRPLFSQPGLAIQLNKPRLSHFTDTARRGIWQVGLRISLNNGRRKGYLRSSSSVAFSQSVNNEVIGQMKGNCLPADENDQSATTTDGDAEVFARSMLLWSPFRGFTQSAEENESLLSDTENCVTTSTSFSGKSNIY